MADLRGGHPVVAGSLQQHARASHATQWLLVRPLSRTMTPN